MKIDGKPQITMDNEVVYIIKGTLDFFIETIKRDKEIRPVFHVFTGTESQIYFTSWNSNEQKLGFVNYLQDECKRLNAVYVIAISDIWFTKKIIKTSPNSNLEKILNENGYVLPSKDPEHLEGLIATINYPNGSLDGIFAPYVRDQEGFPVFHQNPSWIDAKKISFGLVKPWVELFN